jgi:glycosyltransferase involved in cell wall biosynthesis
MPRIVQEAMATGLVVVGTTAGGTKELLQEGETGLTFDVDDGVALTCQIQRLVEDRSLYQSLARRGQLAVQTRFNIQRMIDEIEADLAQCLRQG